MSLSDFQKKVYSEFISLNTSKHFNSGEYEEMKNEFRNHISGCLMIPFITIIGWLARDYFKDEKIKKNHAVFELEAEELLNQSEIKQAICDSLIEVSGKVILTEEKFVNVVTTALFQTDLREKFVIPLEPVLFGFIAFKISEQGISNFCGANDL